MTTYLVMFLSWLMPSMVVIRKEQLMVFIAFIFGITFVLPGLNLMLFRRYGWLSSYKMETHQERILPFVFISLFYVAIAFLFVFKLRLSVNFSRIMVIVAALVVVATLITFFLKVSVHSLAWWGLIGIVLPLNRVADGNLLWPTAGLILVAGAVMSSRLKLNAHTPWEVAAGSVAGFVVGFGGMFLLF
jgi:hypothetical protein